MNAKTARRAIVAAIIAALAAIGVAIQDGGPLDAFLDGVAGEPAAEAPAE